MYVYAIMYILTLHYVQANFQAAGAATKGFNIGNSDLLFRIEFHIIIKNLYLYI